jgi:glutamate synthase domain-containing protein 2/glutamate synthase domain-containing protein 1/glutamate synthase domain-containing protein 3
MTLSSDHNSFGPGPRRGRGLVRPGDAHDGCGVACVARLDAKPIHEVIERGLTALDRLEHRGASGADENSGDGAGILIGLPHAFLRDHASEFGVEASELPEPGRVAVAVCFLTREVKRSREVEARIEEIVTAEGQRVLGWRDVPVDESVPGRLARPSAPRIRQLLIGAGDGAGDQDAFERKLFLIRRVAEIELGKDVSFPSFSSRTIVYKGMLTAPQLARFYADLRDPGLVSVFAVVHSRFSTNTAPSWELAQPLRMIAHNGEINTVLGNMNWMRARESALSWPEMGEDLKRCLPLIHRKASDSAAFDRALELLCLAGRGLPHSLMMMIPMAYENRELPFELANFYRFHSLLLEPWDGPASIVFSDGRLLGGTLDRNGLRPSRWSVTDDGWVALSSEAGTFSAEPSQVVRRGRLQAGHLFIIDLEDGRILEDREAEMEVAGRRPYGEWFSKGVFGLDDLPDPEPPTHEREPLVKSQLAFGYSQEDLRVLLAQMARDAKEPTGSMGNDLALAVLSDKEPSLFSYFKQRFAQVTNPAIDSVREQIVMSLSTAIGPEGNLLDESPHDAQQVLLGHPILSDTDLEKLRQLDHPVLRAETIDTTWPLEEGEAGLEAAIERICRETSEAEAAGARLLILSDRTTGPGRVPVPSLLAISAVNHHLIREGTRLQVALIVESGEPREVHHIAALTGYGASAINPYLLLDSVDDLHGRAALENGLGPAEARERTVQGLAKGLLKTMSKIGISAVGSYRGAQIFEAVGLDEELIERHFTGTPSRIGGIGLLELAREALERHARAYPQEHGLPLPAYVEEGALAAAHEKLLPQGGVYQWRRDGEFHMWEPATIASLQRAAREDGLSLNGTGNGDGPRPSYEEFSHLVNEENASRGLLRGLLRLREAAEPAELGAVEPSKEILPRFTTGAMSLGALSPEAHETLAIAMNRIGGKSNSGEGGEDRRRNQPDPNGDLRQSRIRQVASGRFGVDIDFLSKATQLQIKIAQGAKPGEGGQLPGHKVDEYIAKLRHGTPGVELISPPPHHDIYSIEDLKQLIYDLRTANPSASVSVKLASESGVGTIAAGVAKAGADHIVIAGHDGGTGASPLSSIQAAGVPWEIGLAETQQALIESGLRPRVILQADGQMRTGRDIVVAALLGADEFGLSTAPLIATGCIMMRVCHLNTCPVGIATQDPELRARFAGTPEQVITYLVQVAEEARRLMAALGFERFEDMIGRTDLLEPDPEVRHEKARKLDLTPLLHVPEPPEGTSPIRHHSDEVEVTDVLHQTFEIREIMPAAIPAIEAGEPVRIERTVGNVDRAVGGLTSNAVVRRHGPEGLPDDTIQLALMGSIGQSCGAWLAPGVTIELAGQVNDYCGKGLSGGILAVRPPDAVRFEAERNVIAGNVCLYGATGGKAFFRGLAGERFGVRNSGADAVVEGIGDHGCEYMTGGRVVVLGPTGDNFAAGMSGGVAYVWDPDGRLVANHNPELVDLEPLTDEDAEQVRELVIEHHRRTGSAVAERLLANWESAIPEFGRVMSRQYKAVLAERLAASKQAIA